MQDKINIETNRFAQLVELKAHFKGNNLILAQKLNISREHLSRIKDADSLDGPIGALIERVHAEVFEDVDVSKARNPIDALSENAKQLLEEFASRLDVKPADFIEQMLLRYGQKTFEALEQRKISSTKTELDLNEVEDDAIAEAKERLKKFGKTDAPAKPHK